jgi:MFS family permease
MTKDEQTRKQILRRRYLVLISALFGCAISAAFPQFSITVDALSIATGLSPSFLLTGDILKSGGIVLSMFASGFLYKRFGAKPIFFFALVATALPQFILPHTASATLFVALKIFQGTASVIFPMLLVIIMDHVPEKDRGLATAVFNGIFYAGGGAGGVFAGFVIDFADWVWSYYALGAVMLLVGALWYFTVGIAEHRRFRATADASAAFVSQPVLDPRPGGGKLRRIALLSGSFFVATFVVQGITVDLSLFAKALDFDALQIAGISLGVTIAMIFGCISAGRCSDICAKRGGHKATARLYVLLAGQALILVSVPLLIFSKPGNMAFLLAAACLNTFAASWSLSAFYPVIPDLFDADWIAKATGICGGVGDLGMPVAPLLIGVLFGVKGRWGIGWGTCLIVGTISFVATLLLIASLSRERSSAYKASDA